jgi:ribosome biogenesis GTPase
MHLDDEEFPLQSRKDRKREKKALSGRGENRIHQKEVSLTDLKKGRVLSVTPQGFKVDSEGELFICTLKGVLKKERLQKKNLVTVGDIVFFEEIKGFEGVISYIEERRSFLSRQEARTGKAEQLIAANIDQVLITASVGNPLLKPTLIDRYIIAAKKGKMTPIVLINKIDLLSEEESLFYEEYLNALKIAKIAHLPVSCKTNQGIEELKALMQGKTSVFAGQSGVGKSSLINTVTGSTLLTGDVTEKTKKGTHTTTTASLIPLTCGGFCIDTPGIKTFGVWQLDSQEISLYFDEIVSYGKLCHYPNCSHTHEEICAVKQAVEKGKISPIRYDSYRALLESEDDPYFHR